MKTGMLLSLAPHLHDCSILFDDDGRVYGFHGSGRVTELEPDFSPEVWRRKESR